MSEAIHNPVMLHDVLKALAPNAGEIIVDGTFGAGGYSRGLLESADCKVIGIDQDPEAIVRAKDFAAQFPGRFIYVHANFSSMKDALAPALKAVACDKVDGIVFDLGVSSPQIDTPERGFSFRFDGPLDMRMSLIGETAADVVNNYEEERLADIIWQYGEERRSRHVAKAIVEGRAVAPILTTAQLVNIVKKVVRAESGGINPATRTFQALRIHVNRELESLIDALEASIQLLKEGGRLVVVSFHSHEDRIVKQFLDDNSGYGSNPSRHLPQRASNDKLFFDVPKRKAFKPSEQEQHDNPRSRSARMRVAIRTGLLAADI